MTGQPTALYLFAGAGGGALGFQRAGFRSVGAFDFDPIAIAAHDYLTGDRGTVADLATLQPAELRAACTGRPDVVFTSPPCKSFSGCLPSATAATSKYVDMSTLAQRGIMLALEAWPDAPPGLIVLENVPRIMTRGREWLDATIAMLHAYGYAVRETTHDCGELGGLAQHRRRFLLVARHRATVPEFLYQPPKRRVRGVGEVLGELPCPVPGSTDGGPLHSLPRMSALNWLRLALIPAGGDWRDLPESVALPSRDGRQNGGFGVEDWAEGAHAVLGSADVRNTRASVADPRLSEAGNRHVGKYGVEDWSEPAHTVIGLARTGKAWAGVVDPRLSCAPHAGMMGVVGAAAPSGTIVGAADIHNSAVAYADPRSNCERNEGSLGVTGWRDTSTTVIAHGSPHNGPWQVADPRLTHEPRRGGHAVAGWATPSHAIIASAANPLKNDAVADPRVPSLVGPPIDIASKVPTHIVIRALDATWHRPMTTLELAALQGFPTRVDGAWLLLADGRHGKARELIGNAVPPPAAEAIGRSCMAAILSSRTRGLTLCGEPVWVRRREQGARA